MAPPDSADQALGLAHLIRRMRPEFPDYRVHHYPLGIAQQSLPAAKFHFLRIRIPLYTIDSWDHQIYLPIYLPVFLLYLTAAKVQCLRDLLLTECCHSGRHRLHLQHRHHLYL